MEQPGEFVMRNCHMNHQDLKTNHSASGTDEEARTENSTTNDGVLVLLIYSRV